MVAAVCYASMSWDVPNFHCIGLIMKVDLCLLAHWRTTFLEIQSVYLAKF